MKEIFVFIVIIAILLLLLYNEIKKTVRLKKELKLIKWDEQKLKIHLEAEKKLRGEKEKAEDKLKNAETEEDFINNINAFITRNNERVQNKN